MTTTSLYDDVIEITTEYFGPASHRFIGRMITSHLHKAPEDLETGDLKELVKWIKATVALLTDDTAIINDCTKRLDLLRKRAVFYED